jgi:hypothetical protein
MPLKDADEAVLATLAIDVLRPEVVTAALQEAIVRLDRPAGDVDADRERLRPTVTRLQAELARLTEALGSGGNLPSIVAAITEREAQRSRAEHELATLDQVEQVRGLDLCRVEQDLRAKLADWRGLLSRNVSQARQALRSLVPERLTFTPKNERGERFYVFEGMAVLDRFLAGIALPKALVAPTGRDRTCIIQVRDFIAHRHLIDLERRRRRLQGGCGARRRPTSNAALTIEVELVRIRVYASPSIVHERKRPRADLFGGPAEWVPLLHAPPHDLPRVLRLTTHGGQVDAGDDAIAHAHGTIDDDGGDVVADAAFHQGFDRIAYRPEA